MHPKFIAVLFMIAKTWKQCKCPSTDERIKQMWPIHLLECVLSCFMCVSNSLWPYGWACRAPLSMGFSRQEYCSGLPLPPPGDLSHPEIEPEFAVLPVNSLPIHKGYIYSAIKKNEIMPFLAATWMNLGIIILSEVCQTETDKYFMISLTYRIYKMIQVIQNSNRLTDIWVGKIPWRRK